MTKNEQLKEVREWVIKAVPDIVKLKFGCEVYMDLGNIDGTSIIHTAYPEMDKFFTIDNGKSYPMSSIKEILGRDIRLADVLLAVESLNNVNVGFVLRNQWLEILELWTMETDSLDAQSPETISFLFNLIKQ